MHIRYHIFHIYDILCTYNITHTYGLHTYLQTSDIRIFRMTWTHKDPIPYILPYKSFYWPVQLICPSVLEIIYSSRCNSNTLMLSHFWMGPNINWIYWFVGQNYSHDYIPKFLEQISLEWFSHKISCHPIYGAPLHSYLLLFIRSVTNNNRLFMWLVLLIPEAILFFSRIMALWLSW